MDLDESMSSSDLYKETDRLVESLFSMFERQGIMPWRYVPALVTLIVDACGDDGEMLFKTTEAMKYIFLERDV